MKLNTHGHPKWKRVIFKQFIQLQEKSNIYPQLKVLHVRYVRGSYQDIERIFFVVVLLMIALLLDICRKLE